MSEFRKANFKKPLTGEVLSQVLRRKMDSKRHQKRDAAFDLKRVKLLPLDQNSGSVQFSDTDLIEVVQILKENPGLSDRLAALRILRAILCSPDPPIQKVVEQNLILHLHEYMAYQPNFSSKDCMDEMDLKAEVAWCLANIAAGDMHQTQHLVNLIPVLVHHIATSYDVTSEVFPHLLALRERCCWALGNLASESEAIRKMLLDVDALSAVALFLRQLAEMLTAKAQSTHNVGSSSSDTSLDEAVQTALWVLSGLCRGGDEGSRGEALAPLFKPENAALLLQLSSGFISPAQIPPGMQQPLPSTRSPVSEAAAVEAAWVLVFLTAKDSETAEKGVGDLLAGGVLQALIATCNTVDTSTTALVPYLRCFGNVITGPDFWLGYLNEEASTQIASALLRVIALDSVPRVVLKEALRLAARVLAVDGELILLPVAAKMEIVHKLIQTFQASGDQFDVERDITIALHCLTQSRDIKFIAMEALVLPILNKMIQMLRAPDQECAWSSIKLLTEYCCPGHEELHAQGASASQSLNADAVEKCRGAGLLEALDDLQNGNCEEKLRHLASELADILYAYEDAEYVDIITPEEGRGPHEQQEQQLVSPAGRGRGKHMTVPSWTQS